MASDDMYQYSPGIVTNILARQKAEARQAMLDEMNAKVQQSQMDMAKVNAASLEEQRQASAANQKATADDRFLKGIRDEGPSYELSPEEEAHLKAMGRGGLIMAPAQVSTTEDFGGTPEGNPVEGAAPVTEVTKQGRSHLRPTYEQQQDELQDIMVKRMLEDPKTRPAVKEYLQMRDLFPKGSPPPAGMFEQGSTYRYDPADDSIKDLGIPTQGGNRTVTRSRPPQPSAANQPQTPFVIKIDRDTGESVVEQAKTPEGTLAKLPPGGKLITAPQVPTPKPVSTGTLTALRKAQDAAKSQGMLGGLFGANTAKESALAANVSQYINEFPIQALPEEAEMVREFARQAFADKDNRSKSIDDILKPHQPLPPNIEAPLRGLLSVILGNK